MTTVAILESWFGKNYPTIKITKSAEGMVFSNDRVSVGLKSMGDDSLIFIIVTKDKGSKRYDLSRVPPLVGLSTLQSLLLTQLDGIARL